jgi:pimeloyl-ACP methyl ester carboxylesterase
VLVASVGVTPAEQMLYGTAKHVRQAGFGEPAARRVIQVRRLVDEWRRGRVEMQQAQREVDAVVAEPWFDLAWLPRELATAGAWPDMDFDPTEIFAQVRVPVLLFDGEDDEWQPIDASVAAWRRAARQAGNRDITIVRLARTGHAPTLGLRHELDAVSPDYERELIRWLVRVTARTSDSRAS